MTSPNARQQALLDELLKDYSDPKDILGEHGLLKHLTQRLVERALELAQSIAANPPHAVRLIKQLMRASENASLDELLDKSATFQAVCHAEPDHAEAVAAFFEKRPGNYRDS